MVVAVRKTSAERVTGVSVYFFELAVCLAVGMGLGIFYFGGLWLTVKKLPGSQCPILLALGSYMVRLAVVLARFLSGHGRPLGKTSLRPSPGSSSFALRYQACESSSQKSSGVLVLTKRDME